MDDDDEYGTEEVEKDVEDGEDDECCWFGYD